jgi:hypothetical protein
MSYPLVRELAVDGIPVTVTCRVLKIARQPYYRWLGHPVTDAALVQAHRANALFDAHRDDPEFGYRYLLDEVHDAGVAMSARTAWRICSDNGWCCVLGNERGNAALVPPSNAFTTGTSNGPAEERQVVLRAASALSCGLLVSLLCFVGILADNSQYENH